MDNFNEEDQGGRMMSKEEVKSFFEQRFKEKKEITEEDRRVLEIKSKKAQKLINEIDKIGQSINRKAFMIAMEYGHLPLSDEALLKIVEEAIERRKKIMNMLPVSTISLYVETKRRINSWNLH